MLKRTLFSLLIQSNGHYIKHMVVFILGFQIIHDQWGECSARIYPCPRALGALQILHSVTQLIYGATEPSSPTLGRE